MKRLALTFCLCTFVAVFVQAQGVPTGTITGRVNAEGSSLPGVTVTVASPSLQGTRTTVTGSSGDYIIPYLPAGQYTVTYELSGMEKIMR